MNTKYLTTYRTQGSKVGPWRYVHILLLFYDKLNYFPSIDSLLSLFLNTRPRPRPPPRPHNRHNVVFLEAYESMKRYVFYTMVRAQPNLTIRKKFQVYFICCFERFLFKISSKYTPMSLNADTPQLGEARPLLTPCYTTLHGPTQAVLWTFVTPHCDTCLLKPW